METEAHWRPWLLAVMSHLGLINIIISYLSVAEEVQINIELREEILMAMCKWKEINSLVFKDDIWDPNVFRFHKNMRYSAVI